MNEPNYFALMSGRMRLLIIAFIPLVLVGWTFNASAQTVTNLYSFFGSSIDGGKPQAPLVKGNDGNFYGTAPGGFFQFNTNNFGCVFRISPSGGFTNLHSFEGGDGANPIAGLVQGSDGDFYGTTRGGGTSTNCPSGCGSVFKMTPSGNLTNIYFFGGSPHDGAFPYGALVEGSDGNFYGTTFAGGNIQVNFPNGIGTVFRISPSGSYTSLLFFVGSPNDGASPVAGLVQGCDGNLYGVTTGGGTNSGGAIFRITPGGGYTNLHFFGSSPADPYVPDSGLVQGDDGSFYGSASFGGITSPQNGLGNGGIYRISPNGSYTNLYLFLGTLSDGYFPDAGLLQGSDGNFYGTTQQGGANSNGIIYRISTNGNYTNLYSFAGFPNGGSQPNAGLMQGVTAISTGQPPLGGLTTAAPYIDFLFLSARRRIQ